MKTTERNLGIQLKQAHQNLVDLCFPIVDCGLLNFLLEYQAQTYIYSRGLLFGF